MYHWGFKRDDGGRQSEREEIGYCREVRNNSEIHIGQSFVTILRHLSIDWPTASLRIPLRFWSWPSTINPNLLQKPLVNQRTSGCTVLWRAQIVSQLHRHFRIHCLVTLVEKLESDTDAKVDRSFMDALLSPPLEWQPTESLPDRPSLSLRQLITMEITIRFIQIRNISRLWWKRAKQTIQEFLVTTLLRCVRLRRVSVKRYLGNIRERRTWRFFP